MTFQALNSGTTKPTDDLDHCGTVGLGRREDVHRQRHAVMLGVDDVGRADGVLGETVGAGEGE